MSEQNFDVVVLGGGSGGYAAALRAVQLGKTVGLVEKGKLGGTCLHRGCIPTKALLHSAEVADVSRESEKYGVNVTFDGVDIARVNAYREAIVASKYKGLQGLIKARGITVIEGEGRLTSGTTVQVGDQTITGKSVVLATGSYSRTLPGLEIGGRVITSEQALELDYLPEKVAILGGGVIGVEFASVWRSFGVDVQIIEALPHLVPNEEESISKQFERAFRKRGIAFSLGVRFKSVTQDDQGVQVALEDGTTYDADLLLVAVGRGPATQGLGFEEAGVKTDRGFVLTDERLQTSVPGVYAVGDIVPGLQLAHRGFQQGIFVAEEIAGNKPVVVEDINIPKVTYSDPEVASVGYSEAKAVEKFGADKVSSYEYNLGGNGKSSILGTAGSIKVVRVQDGPVVGIHMIGARVGELIGEGQLIVNWEAYPEDVAGLVHAHPTQNEALGEAHLALAGTPLHAL
ncbi:dihydrolipoyl dehydrogenase [Clavibacter michiganensis]|uniref:Dihydrolipoyl dehydrogenase n=1 Tax=Clavibacter michiganensis subsp. insidiosus TaxID=33014 RepID=A0A0D5CH75_9MICO|nr:dihydrolipoyl dehydrogenase [Clavibacter michiganensis]AJW78971.1 dihydrolipoamide dehydrogenase [Clavibacter michiganensis subsp. insidiosus]OQJ60012.1 dihydrolipoyl dehydrogenase [Clavibacter michiganensis subsp. insidiosus]RII87270.1 dihydrolipoyl dehydrogenase [Clavibacter michiganensis subsp. insidiosus]RIJ42132.1 dihydrolipoyl dehydrogenase [Clavibacter michiganensis subsp. insidiosus]RMC88758.1 dihydrolipoyl dehydrogenase [Clavibacter michiganensis subsp. insidiosus]